MGSEKEEKKIKKIKRVIITFRNDYFLKIVKIVHYRFDTFAFKFCQSCNIRYFF